MNKKKILKWVIIVLCVLGVMIYFDSIFVKNNKEPLFCIQSKVFSDGKSKEFIGIGYKVHKYATSEDIYVYEMVSLFTKFDESKMLELSGGEIVEHEITGKINVIKSSERKSNKDKYPLGEVITNTAELAGFVTPQSKEDISKYDKSFFKDKALIACLIEEDNSYTNYELESIHKKDARIDVKLKILDGSKDLKVTHNYVLIEVDNTKFTEGGYSVYIAK